MANKISFPQANNPIFQAFDTDESFLAGGKLWTYAQGTSTPKAAFQDADCNTPHANPIILDSLGQAVIYLNGDYKFNLLDSDDNQMDNFPVDNINSLSITAYAITLLAASTAAAARTVLGLGTAAVLDTGVTAGDVVLMAAGDKLPAVDGSNLTNLPSDGLPKGYLGGLGCVNAADADHDITVGAGEARDSTDAEDLALTSAMTKQLDAAWAAGTDAGGIATGSIAANTWYHVFLIQKDSDDTIDVVLDTSPTCANIPAGYTEYRRIFSVLTDSSSNIIAFHHEGDQVLWKDPTLDIDATDGTTAALRTLSVPPDVRVKAQINAYTYKASVNHTTYFSSPDATDEAPSATVAPLGSRFEANGTNGGLSGPHEIWTNTSKQIRSRSDVASVTLRIATIGYIDPRGRDD